MITKILFTALVVLAGLTYLRYQAVRSRRDALARQAGLAAERRRAMWVAGGLVALTLAISAILYYQHWQEAYRLFNVLVVNSHTGAEQRYQVYQADIDGRRFRTIDGRLIILSDAERMEVQGE